MEDDSQPQGEPEPGDLTIQLRKAADGDAAAQNKVFARVEQEIKQIARGFLRRESNAHSIQATMLADDAFLKFIGNPAAAEIVNKKHFFRLIAKYVKQLLVDAARGRNALKRGGGATPVELREEDWASDGDALMFIKLTEALERLEQTTPPAAEVFNLYYCLSMDFARIAEVLAISRNEVEGLYRFSAAWLKRELADGE